MTRAAGVTAAAMAVLVIAAALSLTGIIRVGTVVHRAWRGEARAPAVEAPAAVAGGAPSAREDGPSGSGARPMPPPVVGAAGETAASVTQALRARELLVPVRGVEASDLRSTFTEARGSRVHEALDIMAPAGTPVQAVEDGTIARLFTSDAGGLTVYQFDPTRSVAYYYAHLQRYAPDLADGAAVTRGQVLGYVGSTGNADPAAPHLHFAIFVLGPERRWWEGTPVDPWDVLR